MKNFPLIISIFVITFLSLTACNPWQKAVRKHKSLSERQQLDLSTIFIEATRLRILGDMQGAITVYQRIIEVDPLHDASLFELAKLYLVMGETDQASNLIKTAIKVDPENIWYGLAYATILQQAGKFNDAAEQYRQLQQQHPQRPELYLLEAESHENNKQFAKAIDALNRMETVAGISEDAGIQKYYLYMNMGRMDKAMEEIQKLAIAFPENTRYNLSLAEYQMRSGKANQALISIQAVLAVEPSNALARAYLADYYHFAGNNTMATAEISRIISDPMVPVDEKISILLSIHSSGSIYGDSSAVFPMLDSLINIHPDEAKCWAMYADFLHQRDRTNEAAAMWKKSIGLDSSHFLIWDQLMNVLYDAKNYDTLLLYSQYANNLFPEQASAWFFLGAANYYSGLFSQAADALDMALEMNLARSEMKVQARSLLADAWLKTGQSDKSDQMYEQIIASDSSNFVARNQYAYSLALRNINLDRADQITRTFESDFTDKIDFLHTRALILFRKADYNGSVTLYRKALQLGGEIDGALHEHYGDALWMSGDHNEALNQWRIALEAGNTGPNLDQKIKLKKYVE